MGGWVLGVIGGSGLYAVMAAVLSGFGYKL